ncbi:PDZ domain-containing protein [Candidatus Parcubacteria bacterium]|nr:MAG: PDZ domain-containing protein [Candidatus Parcubacteria bacterium]
MLTVAYSDTVFPWIRKNILQEPIINKNVTVNYNSAITDVVAFASPSVVSISVTKEIPQIQQSPFNDPLFRQFFGDEFQIYDNSGQGTQKQEIGGGSGFVVSADGLIVTNKHVVIDENAEYSVLTNDGNSYSAKILARDPVNDLAILKIDKNNLPALELGDSSNIKLGENVIAIGNALGEFRNTVSTGVISGLSRSITAGGQGFSEQLSGVIQTDAAINPGNSGGPLLNLEGQVIGVNTAVVSGASNIGFAIPINDVKKSVESVIRYGRIVRPYLGVRYILINKQLAEDNNLPYDYGALITRGEQVTELAVIPGSPADKAGLEENDIILEVDGKKIDAENDLAKILFNHSVEEVIKLKVYHKGEEKTVEVRLGEFKD